MKYAVVLLALCIAYVSANKVRREVCTSRADCVATVCGTGTTVVCQHPDMNNPIPNGGLCTCKDSDSAPSNNHHQLVQVTSHEFDCSTRQDGFYASPYECSSYFICVAGMGFRAHCYPGLMFNDQTLCCDTAVTTTTRANYSTTTTHAPTPTSPSNNHHLLVPINSNEFDCTTRQDGYHANPYECSSYYICVAGMGFRTHCHPGLVFNEQTLYCDFPFHVICSASGGGTTTHALTTRAPIPTTTFGGPVNSANFCKGKPDGFYKDPMDCSHYYQCSFEVTYHEPCPSGTYFSDAFQGCDWAANVHNCP